MKTITPRCAAAAKTAQQGWLTWRHETKCVVYKVATAASRCPNRQAHTATITGTAGALTYPLTRVAGSVQVAAPRPIRERRTAAAALPRAAATEIPDPIAKCRPA